MTGAGIAQRWPFREGSFASTLHDERTAAFLGVALGVTFTTCFLTGLYSHVAQHPPSWFMLPARPAGLYRVTQGVHVATGIASIPLLLAKLWVVYPKLFTWPPFGSVAGFVERVSLVPLIGGSFFLLATGLANINDWYPWHFNFPIAHFWTAWITIGGLVVHIGAKWSTTRASLRGSEAGAGADADGLKAGTGDRGRAAGLDRRRFLATVLGTSGLLTLFTLGQTVEPLEHLALLGPRRAGTGPQGFPVNRTARAARVTTSARAVDFRLEVVGNVRTPLSLSLDELRALPQHSATLPIACVDGWSSSQRWTGVRVRDLLRAAGAPADAEVTVHSLQQRRSYRTSDVDSAQAHDPDTLLALRVHGDELALDHGFPARLVGPNRPGVMQTKWVTRLVVR